MAVLTAVASHAASLRHGLIFDDFAILRDSAALRTLSGLVQMMSSPRARPESDPSASPVFRPLSALLDWLSWQIFRSETFAQHALSVALHALVSFLLVRLLVSMGFRHTALGLGVLFAAHPATVVAVAPLAGRDVLLGAALLLVAVLMVRTKEPRPAGLLAFLGATASPLCHEVFWWAPLGLASM
ncbi:MAG: hypothetical protein RMJ98_10065, partial [Myxococcales bacterium]|nr:hypothetical protein [Myxococcales bacterium]